MKEKMDFLWLNAVSRMRNLWEDFKHEEKSAAEIVAIILIIVVVIAAALVFKEKIMKIVESVLGKAESFTTGTIIGMPDIK